MRRTAWCITAALLALLLVGLSVVPAARAATGRRVALIIGCNEYRHTNVLRNCVNDARAMAGRVEANRCVPALPEGTALLAACAWDGVCFGGKTHSLFTETLLDSAPRGASLSALTAVLREEVATLQRRFLSNGSKVQPANLPVLVDRIGDPAFVPFFSASRA